MKSLFRILIILLLSGSWSCSGWNPQFESISTRWGKNVNPKNAWKEYPRPQMKREQWKNLNGLWEYAVTNNNQDDFPGNWEGKILVPFAIQSGLSGVGKSLNHEEAVWYKRLISIPGAWKNKKIRLHFEASDFETSVWLNGNFLGINKGGYNGFSFVLNDFLTDKGKQQLVVKVNDPHREQYRSLGKQESNREHYEPCSGIWQTVWMEPVSEDAFVQSLRINTTLTKVVFNAEVEGNLKNLTIKYEVFDNGSPVGVIVGKPGLEQELEIYSPKLWSPDSPFLYDLKVSLISNGIELDRIKSYFGMRTLGISGFSGRKDVLLNGKPVFQMGPLDQNYWPDGGLTPPSDQALEWEAGYLRDIGCNMVRLHIKKNPDRFYYHCDKKGLLVWQDFISAVRGNKNPDRADSEFWQSEQFKMMDALHNHPSVVTWVIFNESWGQHNSTEIYEKVLLKDTSRLINIASGWNDVPGIGDIRDVHDYTFSPAVIKEENENRVIVLGECGGFASAVPPHNWTGRSNKTGIPDNPLHAGFDPEIPRDNNTIHDIFRSTFTSGEAFEKQYQRFVNHLHLLQNNGLRAAVYTQMTDMKREENGWLSFDREVSKMNKTVLGEMHRQLYTPPPSQNIILPASLTIPQEWLYSFMPFPDSNEKKDIMDAKRIQKVPDFTLLNWKKAKGPFGNMKEYSPGILWSGKEELIVKKIIKLEKTTGRFSLRIYSNLSGIGTPWVHTRIYMNGEFIADETTRLLNPELRIAELILPQSVKKKIRKGKNELIIQFIPGLNIKKGQITPVSENILLDVEFTQFADF